MTTNQTLTIASAKVKQDKIRKDANPKAPTCQGAVIVFPGHVLFHGHCELSLNELLVQHTI